MSHAVRSVPDAPPASLPRRALLALLAMLLLSLAVGSDTASAGRAWCRSDPVIKVDGGVADVYLSSYVEINQAATGPAEIVIALPVGSVGQLLATDNGFGGLGYRVSFVTDSTLKRTNGITQVVVRAYVPSSDSALPLQVDFAPRSSNLRAATASGQVNQYWVALKTR